ncbi:SDR family NAD(P)-dependent oxidoreductase [Pseudoalteromonas piscicida]|uniref:SDR family NAD(P)-dependent oxidoreductase n=1 Tax=Pseudoalteromonas piscicida TaxID=43662 RepID=A0AAD0W320_PSEO7|nr:SDR family NAD(P)-dependent oxidoreductase [Pseudoalteromonas piscicida]ASD68191.1 dehydrogenase [Pseudoalteromonas piscicida]AXR01102.1 SDR family NAD(P)-dependent oxidoreductase [Pseudoalteromonas piscicida]
MTKTVLITGGTRGVGEALVTLCLSKGYQVIATGSSTASVANAKTKQPNVSWYVCDLSEQAQLTSLANELEGKTLDIVFHNAGVQQPRDLFVTNNEVISVEQETQINFTAPIMLTRLLFDNIRRSNGTWVFVTSGLAIAPKQSSPIYCANKAGLRAFCKSFSGQIKLHQSQIKVCEAILPLVDTDMTRGRGTGKITPEQAAQEIVAGALKGQAEIKVGKMRAVMLLRKLFPNLIENIMLKA